MSKYFGKCFGPSTRPTFFTQMPCGVGWDTCNLHHKVQFSGSCSQDSGSQGCNFQVPVTLFQRPMSQSPSSRVPCPSVPESRVSGSRISGSQVPDSQVLILDYGFLKCTRESIFLVFFMITKLFCFAFPFRCSSQDMYQVLTNVTTFRDWITKNIS